MDGHACIPCTLRCRGGRDNEHARDLTDEPNVAVVDDVQTIVEEADIEATALVDTEETTTSDMEVTPPADMETTTLTLTEPSIHIDYGFL
ncbi:unnamed protein product [Vicia faba]|uniref:Uncharacterized protein n=1 Tax=Vicia faba TaxID=3906 RepID=A0AAV0YW08_VICFA|nr:unnamed protein product [Vicia faba]